MGAEDRMTRLDYQVDQPRVPLGVRITSALLPVPISSYALLIWIQHGSFGEVLRIAASKVPDPLLLLNVLVALLSALSIVIQLLFLSRYAFDRVLVLAFVCHIVALMGTIAYLCVVPIRI